MHRKNTERWEMTKHTSSWLSSQVSQQIPLREPGALWKPWKLLQPLENLKVPRTEEGPQPLFKMSSRSDRHDLLEVTSSPLGQTLHPTSRSQEPSSSFTDCGVCGYIGWTNIWGFFHVITVRRMFMQKSLGSVSGDCPHFSAYLKQ